MSMLDKTSWRVVFKDPVLGTLDHIEIRASSEAGALAKYQNYWTMGYPDSYGDPVAVAPMNPGEVLIDYSRPENDPLYEHEFTCDKWQKGNDGYFRPRPRLVVSNPPGHVAPVEKDFLDKWWWWTGLAIVVAGIVYLRASNLIP